MLPKLPKGLSLNNWLFLLLIILLGLLPGLRGVAQDTASVRDYPLTSSYQRYGPIFVNGSSPSSLINKNVYLYDSATLANAGIKKGDTIKGLSWYKTGTDNWSTGKQGKFSIWVLDTVASYTSMWSGSSNQSFKFSRYISNAQRVFSGTVGASGATVNINNTGWITFKFSKYIVYNGGALRVAVGWQQTSSNPLYTGASGIGWLASDNPIGKGLVLGMGYESSTIDTTKVYANYATGGLTYYSNGRPIILFTYNTPSTGCNGTPAGYTVQGTGGDSSTAFKCSVRLFLFLNDTSYHAGLRYQWQIATSHAGSFTNISGDTTHSMYAPQLTEATYYRCVITCTNTNKADTTAAIKRKPYIPNTTFYANKCAGDTVIFNGTTYNTSGTYTFHFTGTNGCDSTVTLVITLHALPIATFTVYPSTGVCAGSIINLYPDSGGVSYSWSPASVTSYSTSFTDTIKGNTTYILTETNGYGCSATDSLKVMASTITNTTNAYFCNGGSYTFNGTSYSVAGSYSSTFTTKAGCDSVVTLNLYLDTLPIVTINSRHGSSLCSTTTDTFTATVVYGHRLSYQWYKNGSTVGTNQNTHMDNGFAAGDSVRCMVTDSVCNTTVNSNELNLINGSATYNTINAVTCGKYYVVGGQGFAPGVYTIDLVNASGCDSVVTLNFKSYNVTTNGYSYPNSVCQYNYKSGITYFGSTPSNQVYLGGYALAGGGGVNSYIYLSGGDYKYSWSSSNSTQVTNNKSPYASAYVTSDTRFYLKVSDSLCSDTVSFLVTAPQAPTKDIYQTICHGDSYSFAGNSLTYGANYGTLISGTGCDTLVTLYLSVLDALDPTFTVSPSNTICQGAQITLAPNQSGFNYRDSWSPNTVVSNYYNNSVTDNPDSSRYYTHTITSSAYNYISVNGGYPQYILPVTYCSASDSTFITVKATPPNDSFGSKVLTSVCLGKHVYFYLTSYDTANTYTWMPSSVIHSAGKAFNSMVDSTTQFKLTVTARNGCSVLDSIKITALSPDTVRLNATICAGTSYSFSGSIYSTAGTYSYNTKDTAGCDSTTILTLKTIVVTKNTKDTAVCAGSTVMFNGNTYNTTGLYSDTFILTSGCDSIIALNLTVVKKDTIHLTATLCSSGSYTFNGSSYNTAGTYTASYKDIFGCDSIVTLNLVSNAAALSLGKAASCINDTLKANYTGTPQSITWYKNNTAVATTTAGTSSNSYGITVAGNKGGTAGTDASHLSGNLGIAVDKRDNLYICDGSTGSSYRIIKWASGADTGTSLFTTIYPTEYIKLVYADTLYFCTQENARSSDTSGNLIKSITTFYSNTGICKYGNNVIYFATTDKNSIYATDKNLSTYTHVAGNSSGSSGSGKGSLNNPQGITTDAAGNLYIADKGNNRIVKWVPGDSTGTTVAGDSTGISGSDSTHLSGPADIKFDYTGAMIIADGGNNRVVRWVLGAKYGTTILGSSTGSGSDSVHLNNPTGIAIDAANHIFVSDFGNNRVQELIQPSKQTLANNYIPNAAGTYYAIVNFGNGCSITTGSTTLGNTTDSIKATICQGKSYTFNRTTLTTAGIYSDTFTLRTGCDSIVTLNLSVNAATNSTQSASICSGNSYTFNSKTLTTAGTYTDTLSSKAGCDSIIILILTVNDATLANNGHGCVGDSLTFNTTGATKIQWSRNGKTIATAKQGKTYGTTVAGVYSSTNAGAGKDSLHLLLPMDVALDDKGNIYVCDNGNNRIQKYAPGSRYGVTVAGQKNGNTGSDSAHLNNPRGVFVDKKGNVYVSDGVNSRVQKWIPGATFGITVAGGNGSGSGSNQLNFPVGLYVDDSDNVYVGDLGNNCVQKWAPGAKYGTTVAGVSGVPGIDSTHLNSPGFIYIDKHNNVYVSDAENIRIQKWVPGAKYGTTVAGITGKSGDDSAHLSYYLKGVCVDAADNVFVADNNRVQKWASGSKYGATVAGHADNSYSYDSTGLNNIYGIRVDSVGNIYTADEGNSRVEEWKQPKLLTKNSIKTDSVGTYTATATFSNGCTITKTITIKGAATHSVKATICQDKSYTFNTKTLTTAGIYSDTITSKTGCDSIVTLTLSVNTTGTSNTKTSICAGNAYTFNGKTYNTAGTYLDTLKNKANCDSVVTLTLNVNSASGSTLSASICAGKTYAFYGKRLTTAGTYLDTLKNKANCDSVVTLTLNVSSASGSTLSASICAGKTYAFYGKTLTTAGTYTDTLKNKSNCDSVVTLTLNVNSINGSTLSASICAGKTYAFYGKRLTTAGTYLDTLKNKANCDSVVTLTLNVNSASGSTLSASICAGKTYAFYGKTLTTAGTYTDTLKNKANCDSVVTLTLNVNSASGRTLSASICAGKTYAFYGKTLTTAGTYTDTLKNKANCDSVVTLTLNANSASGSTLSASICAGKTYAFYGKTLTTAGTYTDTLKNKASCDSIATLILTVNNLSSNIINASIFSGDSYTFNGTAYTTSGIYTAHFINKAGCDSVVTLNLSVFGLKLTLTAGSGTSIIANWNKRTGPYKLYYGQITSGFAVVNVTDTTYTINKPAAGTTYLAYVVDQGSLATPKLQSNYAYYNVTGGACTTVAPKVSATTGINTGTLSLIGSASNYQVYYKKANSTVWKSYNTTYTTYSLNGLSPSTCYVAFVSNICGSTYGYSSAIDTFCTSAMCVSPSTISISGLACKGFTANWTAVPGVTGYQVYLTAAGKSTNSYRTNTNSFSTTSLSKGTLYYIYVNSRCNATTVSTNSSASATVTTSSLGCKDEDESGNNVNASPTTKLSIYPNPSNGEFTIDITGANIVENTSVQVLNMLGQVMSEQMVDNNTGHIHATLNNNKLAVGVYLIKVINGTETYTARVIINN